MPDVLPDYRVRALEDLEGKEYLVTHWLCIDVFIEFFFLGVGERCEGK
jgi:hypothetical protein